MPLGIAGQQAPGIRKIAMMTNARKHIEQFALLRLRVRSAIGRQQRQRQFPGNLNRRLIPRLFLAAVMPLQFDINAVTSKTFAKPLNCLRSEPNSTFRKRVGERPLFPTRQTNQPLCVPIQLTRREASFAFFVAQFHQRDRATQILVTFARFDQHRESPTFRRRNLRADVRTNPFLYRRVIKARRAINAVAIEYRHRAHPALGASLDHLLRNRRSFEKTERRPRMKFNVHFSFTSTRRRLIVKSPHKPALPRRVIKNTIHAMPRPRTRLRNLRSPGSIRNGMHPRNDVVGLLLTRLRSFPKINRQIPLVVIPTIFLPPFARAAPRPRRSDNISPHPAKTHAQRPALLLFIHFHVRNEWWPQHAESRCRKFRGALSI